MKKKARRPSPRKTAAFPAALKSFLGHLEGTSKAAHTIRNYRLDLLSFERFFSDPKGRACADLERLDEDDLERYHHWLKAQGLKNNTRRRKLLTVQKFFKYLARRKRLPEELARKFPTPGKIERLPFTVRSEELLEAIRKLPSDTPILARNRVLLWILAETGCLVSEAARLRFEDAHPSGGGGQGEILFEGKNARKVTVSSELVYALSQLSRHERKRDERIWAFPGHNRFGAMADPITPRGVELLVRAYAARLGWPELTPRTFRHSAVLQWMREGVTQTEIQRRLGLKSAYAFRVYGVLAAAELKSRSEATSSA